jgi:hypothetical protein
MSNGPADTHGPADTQAAPVQPFDRERWLRLRLEQLAVDVVDPLGHNIGLSRAGRYQPVDGQKHILVGEFDHYGFYKPPFGIGAEADINVHIFPDKPFRFLLNHVADAPGFDKGHLQKRQRGQGYCVECEITPGFTHSVYFPTGTIIDIPSPLVGRKIGAYGPWVHDNGHGGRPEIHPCQFLWWQEEEPRFRRYFLFSQDGSDRFSRAEHFDGPVKRPWTTSPYRVNIIVALRPKAEPQPQYYSIDVIEERELEEMPNAGDRIITASLPGENDIAVVVRKDSSNPDEMLVSLSKVERDPDKRFLRCFLYIGLNIGRDNVPGTGYALVRLTSPE